MDQCWINHIRICGMIVTICFALQPPGSALVSFFIEMVFCWLSLRTIRCDQTYPKKGSQVFLLWQLCLLLMPPRCRTRPHKMIMHKKVINHKHIYRAIQQMFGVFLVQPTAIDWLLLLCLPRQDHAQKSREHKRRAIVRRLKGSSSQWIRDLYGFMMIYVYLCGISMPEFKPRTLPGFCHRSCLQGWMMRG